jgi:exodeoxyribonuclease VII small subunit
MMTLMLVRQHAAGPAVQNMTKLAKNLKFEDAMQRLDAIVAAMEAGEIGIEESLEKYEEAMQLAARCREILDRAEERIQKIQLDAAGKPQAVPFQPGTEAAEGAPGEEED